MDWRLAILKRIAAAVLVWIAATASAAAAYTEFYCNASTGANTNSGSTEAAAELTLTGGNWVSSTGVYTKAGSDLSGVTAGEFAAVMVDGGTVAAIVGRITAVDDGADTVTISTTAKSGSLADQTGTATLTVGGPWKGPNAAVDFPLDVITNALTNAGGDTPRVNLKNNATYSVTASIVPNQAGPITVQGYTTEAGDGGVATIDGGATGSAYAVLSSGSSSTDWQFIDLTIQNNGNSGTVGIVSIGGARSGCRRVKVANSRLEGITVGAANQTYIECEITTSNTSATANRSAIAEFAGVNFTCTRCYIHDNAGSTTHGMSLSSGSCIANNCIFDTNGGDGIRYGTSSTFLVVRGCEFYNNGSDGIELTNTSGMQLSVENCNFIDNGGWGINGSGAGLRNGAVINCAFGAGTAANGSGTTTGLKAIFESGSVTYTSDITPWVDPANADFRINLAAAKGAGRGTFLGAGSTLGYPDIGAAQHQDAGGGSIFGGVVR